MTLSIASLGGACPGVVFEHVPSDLPPLITDANMRDAQWTPPDVTAIKPLRLAAALVDAFRTFRSHLEGSHAIPLSRIEGLVELFTARKASLDEQIVKYTAAVVDGKTVGASVGDVAEAIIAQRYLPRAMFVPANVIAADSTVASLSGRHRLVMAGRFARLCHCKSTAERQLAVAFDCLHTLKGTVPPGGAATVTIDEGAESDGEGGDTDIDDGGDADSDEHDQPANAFTAWESLS